MKYKVLVDFTDLVDGNHIYRAGDEFPREGAEVTEGRIAELASKKNKRKTVLIEKVSKSSLPTKEELAAQLTNPELAEAIEAKKSKEGSEESPKKKSRSVKKEK